MSIILISGTHSWDGTRKDWWSTDSDFTKYLESQGHTILDKDRPFVWSTRIGGVGFGDEDLAVWKAAGINLYAYLVPPRCPDKQVPGKDVTIISHSHGLQVVLFAAAAGLKINTFIDICGPVRKDMMPIATAAKPNIRRWVHFSAGRRDRMQWFGTLFDGHFGIVRGHPLAHQNVSVKDADHGSLLRDPAHFSKINDALKPN